MVTSDGFTLHHALVPPVAGGAAEPAAGAAAADARGGGPARWMLVLHGVFGSGANWRTFARRLAGASAGAGRPWGFVLVDLRGHGLSQGPPPPHTLAAAADDLIRLEARLGLPVRGVMGHSLGGKVALAYMARRSSQLERAFLLDADPGADPAGGRASGARSVLDMLTSMPQPLPSRDAFVEAVRSRGFGQGVADWLAMSLRRADDGFRLRLGLEAIAALLDDSFSQDLWSVLEDPRRAERALVVLGGQSEVVSAPARARLLGLAEGSSRLGVSELEGAGHWLHVDDPDGLLATLRAAL